MTFTSVSQLTIFAEVRQEGYKGLEFSSPLPPGQLGCDKIVSLEDRQLLRRMKHSELI